MNRIEWLPVSGLPYEVSRSGQVRNLKGRIMRTFFASGGLAVTLSKHDMRTTCRVARLVGAAFSRCYRDDRYPQFRNGDPRDCRNGNIKWVARSVVSRAPYTLTAKA